MMPMWHEGFEVWALSSSALAGRPSLQTSTMMAAQTSSYGKIYNQNVPDLQPDAVFHQQPDGQFLEVGASWGFAHPGQTRAVVAADLNQDGTLELVRRDLIGPTTIHQRPCVPGSWVTFSLRQPDRPNTHAVGATIRARTGDTMVCARMSARVVTAYSAPVPTQFTWASGRTRLSM